jgi:FKBP-type peptidyl-prolyl cis-trans isomerase
MKSLAGLFLMLSLLMAGSAFAQGGPTKVTGKSKSTASGVEYWDIKEGTGKTATEGSTAVVNYTGWLTNGKMFDTSVGKQPFPVEGLGHAPVIKGWNAGLFGMKVGGKRQLKIPPGAAYGERGFPPVIPPSSTLIFDVELLDVK